MSKDIYKFEKSMLHGESIHISKKINNFWFKKHWHNYFEIIYYHGCKGYCILNGESHTIEGDCLFLLTPKDFHQIVTEDTKDSYSLIIAFNEQMIDRKLLNALTIGAIAINNPDDMLCRMINSLYDIFLGNLRFREQELYHHFNSILIRILQNGNALCAIPQDIPKIIRESISYMLSNPTETIVLDTFAEKFGITKTYFSRLFHESTGITFKAYLTDLRIEYAKRMLEDKDISVIDVGFECGFRTPSQFIRSFKNAVGITPSEYRSQRAKL